MSRPDRSKLLIEILLDKNARIDERDDAAMDLADYADALDTLVLVASNKNENETILSSCGESIAEIWKKAEFYDENIVASLALPAQSEIKGLLGRK